MDPNNSLQNFYFSIQMHDFKISNAKTFPEIKAWLEISKNYFRPFNFEKYELTMRSIEKVDVN